MGCLGDLFSVNWMEDSDAEDTTVETLGKQYEIVKNKTTRSHVLQWSDLTFLDDHVSEYIGGSSSSNAGSDVSQSSSVSARQIDLRRVYDLYSSATSGKER